jgi:hypothetical protein
MLSDLQVDKQGSSLHGQTLTLAIENTGRVAANDVVVEVWSDFAAEGGTLLTRHTFASIAPASSEQATLSLDTKSDRPIFIRIDPESYTLEDDDAIKELDERNNCALLSPFKFPPAP